MSDFASIGFIDQFRVYIDSKKSQPFVNFRLGKIILALNYGRVISDHFSPEIKRGSSFHELLWGREANITRFT